MRQHLTAVQAAVQVGNADAEGVSIGSQELVFAPQTVKSGQFTFSIGTAGSVTLVLQTVLPALMLASEPSKIVLEGGTHNPFAPPYDFLARSFLPLVNKMGVTVSTDLENYGFYPAGGGKFTVSIDPASRLKGYDLTERGEIIYREARAIVANLPGAIGHRECKVIGEMLNWSKDNLKVVEAKNATGPGNVVIIEIGMTQVTEVFTGFGERGVLAETVAKQAAKEANEYLSADVPVGVHLADQLMIPFALAKSGSFVTMPLSQHSITNMKVIQLFLDTKIKVEEIENRKRLISFS